LPSTCSTVVQWEVKSQNTFLTKGNVKLGDCKYRILRNAVDLAETYNGTPHYLTPEIYENKPYNDGSGIWNLGCILYEVAAMIASGRKYEDLIVKIIADSYPQFPSCHNNDLCNLVQQLCR
jgi:NIMA (never in mitosis gene a)-related kinase